MERNTSITPSEFPTNSVYTDDIEYDIDHRILLGFIQEQPLIQEGESESYQPTEVEHLYKSPRELPAASEKLVNIEVDSNTHLSFLSRQEYQ